LLLLLLLLLCLFNFAAAGDFNFAAAAVKEAKCDWDKNVCANCVECLCATYLTMFFFSR